MNNTQQKLLEQNIADLPLNKELKKVLELHNISTLKELLEIEVANWYADIPNFNYHYQHEIIEYLAKNGLTGLLKEE